MMIEIFMLVAAATIFVVIARRFPATAQGGEGIVHTQSVKPESFWESNRKTRRSWTPKLRLPRSIVQNIFQKTQRLLITGFNQIGRLSQQIKTPRLPRLNRIKPKVQVTPNQPKEQPVASELSVIYSDRQQHNLTKQIQSPLELADEWFAKQDFVKAENYYLKAALQFPKEVKIYNRLGVIYLDRKSFRDAKESLATAVRLDPQVPSRHYNLALAFAGLNDRKNALRSIQAALALDPKNAKYRRLMDKLAG